MGKIIKLLRMLIILITVLSINGCINTSSAWHQIVPQTNIIFQSVMWNPYELNFIQADGSNHQVLNLDVNFIKPVWSSDGAIIYGLSNPVTQPPYEFIGYPAYWKIKNHIFKRCDKNLPYYGQIEEYKHTTTKNEVILYNAYEIVIFDMDACQVKSTLVDFNNPSGVYMISGFSYFPQTQEIVYGRLTVENKSRKYSLRKMNLKTGEETELAEGINPAWSPDGKQIAFLGLDGLYVIQADGQQSQKLINRQFFDPYSISGPSLRNPQPYWSPDGQWLIYHQCIDTACDYIQTPIYKVRVSDGEETKIYTGGKFPSWQP